MSAIVTQEQADRPAGYTGAQIVLHWIMAAMVIFQVLMGENIGPAWNAFRQGTTPAEADLFAANVHVAIGLGVLALAVLRIALRVSHGAPPMPAGQSRLQTGIAHLVHALLYLVIVAMPISGAAAWFGGAETAGQIHHLAKPVIVVAVALHVAGALLQHFVKKTDVLTRMLRPQRPGA
jgi:cytochrome b561